MLLWLNLYGYLCDTDGIHAYDPTLWAGNPGSRIGGSDDVAGYIYVGF